MARRVAVRRVAVGRGLPSPAPVRRGELRHGDRVHFGFSMRHVEACRGEAGHGKLRRVQVGHGKRTESTSSISKARHAKAWSASARPGESRCGAASCGGAWHGAARYGVSRRADRVQH